MKKSIILLIGLITVFTAHSQTESYEIKNGDSVILSYSRAPEYVEGEILLEFKGSDDNSAIKSVNGSVKSRTKTKAMEYFGKKEFITLKVANVSKAVEALKKNPNVKWVSPNYIMSTDEYPNDSIYLKNTLWGLNNIKANQVWPNNKGNQQIFVGIIDEGIMHWHEDLCGQVWRNPYDTLDGIDNDGNGYIDDINGWDFFNNDKGIYDYPDNHGTHVSGTIGALGNNTKGVVGVAPNVTIISAKFLQGNGSLEAAIKAIDYITDLKLRHGLNIVATNNSWGGGGFAQALQDAIERAKQADILFIAAAGNSAANADATPFYPSGYTNDNIISVASITSTDQLSSFSNYGANSVDIGAPGSDIVSTVNSNFKSGYASYSGTSMATPHVTGAVVLYKSAFPSTTYSQIKTAILNNVRIIPALSGKCLTGGTLDIGFISNIVSNSTVISRNCVTPSNIDTTPPLAPTNFRVENVTNYGGIVYWDIPSDPESGIKQTSVQYITKSNYDILTCTSSRGYNYAVYSYNIDGRSLELGPGPGQLVTVQVKVYNNQGLASPWGVFTFKTLGVEDSTYATVSNFSSKYVYPNSIEFSSTAVDLESGIARYRWQHKATDGSTGVGYNWGSNTNPYTLTHSTIVYGKTYEVKAGALNKSCMYAPWSSSLFVNTDTSGINTDLTPPSTPTNLKSIGVTTNSISITWNASTDNVGISKYQIFYKKSTGSYTSIESFGTGISLISLEPSTEYIIYVVAIDKSGNKSEGSNVISITTLDIPDIIAPSTPSNLSVSEITTSSFKLSWSSSTDNKGVAGYDVYYKESSNTTYLKTRVTNNFITLSSLKSNTEYDMYVVAIDGANNQSLPSINVTTRTLYTTTIFFTGTSSGLKVTLDWEVISLGTVSSVKIEEKKGNTGSFSLLKSYSNTTDDNFTYSVQTPGTYYYRIYVIFTDDTSAYKDIVANIKRK